MIDAFERAQRRNACRRCGSSAGIETKDGSKCDGMPGISYRVCNNCGHAAPITRRPRKEKLRGGGTR